MKISLSRPDWELLLDRLTELLRLPLLILLFRLASEPFDFFAWLVFGLCLQLTLLDLLLKPRFFLCLFDSNLSTVDRPAIQILNCVLHLYNN